MKMYIQYVNFNCIFSCMQKLGHYKKMKVLPQIIKERKKYLNKNI